MADIITASNTPGGVNAQPVFATKTVTFTGAANLGAIGNVPLFTITGQVQIKKITGYCLTTLVGATATLALGVTGATSLFLGVTTATTLANPATPWWLSTAGTVSLAIPAAMKDIAINANVVATVATAAITAGVLRIDVEYIPLSAGASLV